MLKLTLMNKTIVGLVALILIPIANAETIQYLNDGNLTDWTAQGFDNVPKKTDYAVEFDEELNQQVVVIDAQGSGSGYIRQEPIPFGDGAVLKVVWRLESAQNPKDEKTKPGDDFPIRMYLTDDPSFGADTLVLVQSTQQPAGSSWESPYDGFAAHFQMYAFGGSDTELGTWQTVNIPVGKLWAEKYGSPPSEIGLIGFMGDSDNAGGSSLAKIATIELILP